MKILKTPCYIGTPCYRSTAAQAAHIVEASRVRLAANEADYERATRRATFVFSLFIAAVAGATFTLAYFS